MLNKKSVVGLYLIVALVLVGVVGCSSGSSTAAEEDAFAGHSGSDFSALEIYEAREQWLLPGTDLVVIGDPGFLFEIFAEMMPAEPGTSRAERGQGFRSDVSRIWADRFAINSVDAEAVMFSMVDDSVSLVLDGDFPVPEWAQMQSINGVETHFIECECDEMGERYYSGLVDRFLHESDVWMVVLDDPAGVAVFFDEQAVEEATERIANGAVAGESPHSERFRELFEGGGDGRVVMASSQGNQSLADMIREPVERLPEGIMLSIGVMGRISFVGASEQLDAIEEPVAEFFELGQEVSSELRNPYEDESLSYAIRGAASGSLMSSYLDSITTERQQTSLSYEVALPESLMAFMMLRGLLELAIMNVGSRYSSMGEEADSEEMVSVVVSARNIPAGTPLSLEYITTEEVPSQLLPANPLMRQDLETYLDQPTTVEIEAGSMLLTNDFEVDDAMSIEFPEERYSVLVAAQDIPEGTDVESNHITVQELPRDSLPDNALLEDDMPIYLSQPVYEDIEEGDILRSGHFTTK